ncbi:C-type lectin 37Da-like [Armigeres subalbatus]|uniref:C-type lectin 37Da-like n=1 Tax=Armigeres subalbatus TaxID=124917 RepID=UPI002ED67517
MQSKGISVLVVFLSFHSLSAIKKSNARYFIPSIHSNWFKANEFCNSLQMRLVVIKSQADNDAVAQYVQTTDKFSEVSCGFWIGGSDLAEEGVFIWVATGERVTYANWKKDEPNNAGQNEDCIQLAYIPSANYNWSWNDNPCAETSLYFICESVECDCVQQF